MAAALVSPQFWLKLLWKARKLVVTGLRLLSWMKVMAKKNSFHAATPETRATVRRPGQLRGSTTRSMTCSSFAPSIRAASSKSRGSPTRQVQAGHRIGARPGDNTHTDDGSDGQDCAVHHGRREVALCPSGREVLEDGREWQTKGVASYLGVGLEGVEDQDYE